MSLSDIALTIGAAHLSIPPLTIKWLLTDSRSLAFPDETLFFALKTAKGDGHGYIQELYTLGVRSFVVSKMLPEWKALPAAHFLVVPDTLLALQQVAAAHRSAFRKPIIGITGSNGKTIVKEWLFQLIKEDRRIVRSPRSYNSQVGVPLSVWQLQPDTELGIFEAGISQVGEMERLEAIVKPTIGIITNLGDAHQEHFKSLTEKCQEKLKLFRESEVVIYPKENQLIDASIAQLQLPAISWGVSDRATLQLQSRKESEGYTHLTCSYQTKTLYFKIPFVDQASVENSLTCVTLLCYLGYSSEQIADRIERLDAIQMRLEVKEAIHGSLLINDAYNSDVSSLTIALDFLSQQAQAKQLARTVILSDIEQSERDEAALYARVAALLQARNVGRFIGIGTKIKQYGHAFAQLDAHFYYSTEEFLRKMTEHHFSQQVILLKGARQFAFEQIAKQLEQIHHKTVLEVNLSALVQNLNYFRSKLRPETKLMCMVKAFAYGSGAIEVARVLQHHRCDYLAVAVADEGAELRRAGIHLPIVVMDPEVSALDILIEHKLEPEIYSFKMLYAFVEALERQGISNYPIHVKIDSGMNRLGFEPTEMVKLSTFLSHQGVVVVRSLFSHLAAADDPTYDPFTREQIAIFTHCAEQVKRVFSHHIPMHILNSAGIERFSEAQFDMVRLGIGHYGVSALKSNSLQHVCTLKTTILQIKQVAVGASVGYGRKAIMTQPTKIAVLPIGYADGFDRRFGNGVGEVLVHGVRCKVVGNVCMDLTMVDVTHTEASEGDEVIIFNGDLTITEQAERIGTISYELLTSLSRRVKRVYFQE